MAYPDSTIADPWAALSGGEVTSTNLKNNTTDQLNTLVPRVSDSGWTTATLSNSWVSFDGGTTFQVPQYRLKGGVVYCGGLMRSGTLAATVFTLPTGYRPAKSRLFMVYSNTAAAQILVTAAGVLSVNAYLTGGTNASVALEGVTFVAEQ